MAKVAVSVVVPTYNEVSGIAIFLKQLRSVLDRATFGSSWQYEVLVVDDNSPDHTAAAVRHLQADWPALRLLVRTEDHGLGKSIKFGIEQSHGDVIVGMDADLNHSPSDIPGLLAALKDSQLAVASRFVAGGGMAEWQRYFPTLAFNFCLRVLGFPIWDNASGFYAVRKKDLLDIGLERIYYGYGDYHLRLVWFVAQAHWEIVELPTWYGLRIAGESKSRLWKMALQYLTEAVRLRFIAN